MEQQDEFTEFTEEQAKWLQENAWWWDYIKDSEQPLLSQTLGLEESIMNKIETYMNGWKIAVGQIIKDHVGVGVVELNGYWGLRVNYMNGGCKSFSDYLGVEEDSIKVVGETDWKPYKVEGRI